MTSTTTPARVIRHRRSSSKPESPTTKVAFGQDHRIGSWAMGTNLAFLRQFSVTEQDIVVCNRVRFGADPTWALRQRPAISPHLQKSLSIEEARRDATRKARRVAKSRVPPVVQEEQEDDRTDDENTEPNDQKIKASTHRRVDTTIDAFASSRQLLTPRERAMHGRYLMREAFANGSYGSVCAAEDLPSHREVAVKIVPKHLLVSMEEKQSVVREQVIHKELDHPQIVKLLDVFEDDKAHYFILERADSGALAAELAYEGMPEDRCRHFFRQLLQALEYLHVRRIVHQDIKPSNVLLQSSKTHGSSIKLCDFGASRAYHEDETGIPFAGVFGTPGYVAPELLLGVDFYGPAVDMFSAGVLLFEMLFGYAPFYPPSSCTYLDAELPTRTQVSVEATDLVTQLLARDPTERMTAAQALCHPWLQMSSEDVSDGTRASHSSSTRPTSVSVSF